MNRQTIITKTGLNLFRILAVAGILTNVAYAEREGIAFVLKQAQRSEAVEISGGLNCIQPEFNTGEACTLQITDAGSQKVYRIADSNKAMELYFSGKKSVKLSGKLTAAGAVSVVNIQAL